ncbi:MAG: SDR family oxidoreductase [Alphaproteobacteria bacterium]|nr:SDR family oxidoreductase [Alphaproteobacteria bacterium]
MEVSPFSLSGKKILVTGASSGIGRSVAIECSKSGAEVCMLARDSFRLQETLDMLKPGNHQWASIDLNKYDLIESVIENFVKISGPVNGVVHAAGIEFSAPFNLTKPVHFEKLFSINLISAFELSRILVQKKYMDSSMGGSIVFISSIRALFGQEGSLAYSSSKGALSAGTRSLALELSKKRIRVNAILPSIITTPMTQKLFDSIPEETYNTMLNQHPLGFGSPTDVSLTCIFLLSDASRWMTGTNLILDGGFSAR